MLAAATLSLATAATAAVANGRLAAAAPGGELLLHSAARIYASAAGSLTHSQTKLLTCQSSGKRRLPMQVPADCARRKLRLPRLAVCVQRNSDVSQSSSRRPAAAKSPSGGHHAMHRCWSCETSPHLGRGSYDPASNPRTAGERGRGRRAATLPGVRRCTWDSSTLVCFNLRRAVVLNQAMQASGCLGTLPLLLRGLAPSTVHVPSCARGLLALQGGLEHPSTTAFAIARLRRARPARWGSTDRPWLPPPAAHTGLAAQR